MNSRIPIALHLPAPPPFPPSATNGKSPHPRQQPRLFPQTAVEHALSDANSNNYESICIPITNDKWRQRWSRLCLTNDDEQHSGGPIVIDDSNGADKKMRTTEEAQAQQRDAELWRAADGFRKDEVNLTKIEEADGVIGFISDWLELDSDDEWVRLDSELALRQELAYVSYLNMRTVVLPPPRNRRHVADYARAVNACLAIISPYLQLSIRIPIHDPQALTSPYLSTPSPEHDRSASPASFRRKGVLYEDLNQTWEMWDVIRTVCGYNQRLNLTLDLTAPLPISSQALSRWNAEPLKHLFLPASAFVPNNGGYPVLPKPTQNFIKDAIKHRPTIILSKTRSGIHRSGGQHAYQQYIRYLEKTSPSVMAMEDPQSVEYFAAGYWDYLQAPLQPLMDNLQSTTYEVFERDPVKYANYEQAVYLALCDHPDHSEIVICVAGAGRGPLVSRCITAIRRSSRTAKIYALEKNASAFVTLQERKENEWGDQVILLFGDMRTIPIPEKADILVSELLGSFGDNELSPECLDGAMRFLKSDGISIPSSYTAHLAPLSSSKLFNEANSSKDLKHAETPYVVMFQAVNDLSAEPQECWEFCHPRRDAVLDPNGLPYTNSHNTRSAHLTFHIPNAGILHGLAGYFEAVLYGDVGLSIHPDRKDGISPNMLSWFPIFFPFKDPLYLPANSELDVSIWRLTDKKKVWYEWYGESFFALRGADLQQRSRAFSSPENGSPALGIPSRSVSLGGVVVPPSPMVDAAITNFDSGWTDKAPQNSQSGASAESRVKIGQTALHNPGGRSFWIGL